MEPPINLANLRLITDGKRDVEAELFRIFSVSATSCLQKLHEACSGRNDENWREQAHAFKGICYNLGAEPLGRLCEQAQNDFHAPAEEKLKILSEMEQELVRVTDALKDT